MTWSEDLNNVKDQEYGLRLFNRLETDIWGKPVQAHYTSSGRVNDYEEERPIFYIGCIH